MIYGIVMLYVLRVINAPTWCFVLDWFCIIASALTLILKTWASSYKTSNKAREKAVERAIKKATKEMEKEIEKERNKRE